jgi:hypothetical protein
MDRSHGSSGGNEQNSGSQSEGGGQTPSQNSYGETQHAQAPTQGYPSPYGQSGGTYPPTQAYPPGQYPSQGGGQQPPPGYGQYGQGGQQGVYNGGQSGGHEGGPPPNYYGGPPPGGYPPQGNWNEQPPRRKGIPTWAWLVPLLLVVLGGGSLLAWFVLGAGNTNRTTISGQVTATPRAQETSLRASPTAIGRRTRTVAPPRRTATAVAIPSPGTDDGFSATATAIAEEFASGDFGATMTAIAEEFGEGGGFSATMTALAEEFDEGGFSATMTALSQEFDDLGLSATLTAISNEFGSTDFQATFTAVAKELEELGIEIPTFTIPDLPQPGTSPIPTPGGGPREPERISLTDFQKLYSSSSPPVVVDVRGQAAYVEGHIKGSINVPLAETSSRLGELPRDRLIVAYCQ